MSRGRINALPLKLMPIGQSLPLLSRLIIPKSFLTRRDDLMEIMDGPHGQTYTVVISQLQTDQWYASIDDNTLADAILDRLMHNAHRLQLKGESMRKILSQLTEDEHLS
jgi:DNA replication protein DnaC